MNFRKTDWTDCLLLTLVIGTFYGILLGHFALFTPDEARYAEIAREMVQSGNYLVPRLNHVLYFEKPPFFYWLLAFAYRFFGASEWAMRFWTASFAVFGCIITYATTRKLYDRQTGLLASFILATSLLYFAMGHAITLDIPVSVLLTATLYCTLLGLHSPHRYYFWTAAIFSALAVLTKGLIGVVFPIMIVGLWVLLLNEWHALKKWHLPGAILIFFIIALPWHIAMQMKFPGFLNFYFWQQQFARYSTLALHRYEPIYYLPGIFLLGFFPWSAFIFQSIKNAWPRWRDRKQHKTAVFLLIWFFTILIFFSVSDSQLIPYLLPIFPPAAILTARYLIARYNQKTLGTRIGFILILLMTCAVSVAVMLIPNFYHVANPMMAPYYLLTIALLLGLTIIIASFVFWHHQLKQALYVIMIGFGLSYFALILAIPYVNHRAIKTLAQTINSQIKPSDEVVAYEHYFQDLPYYTKQRVTVVNAFGELRFGTEQEDTSAWMINETEFWKRWYSQRRLFVLMRKKNYDQLIQKHPNMKRYILAQTTYNLLLCNRLET